MGYICEVLKTNGKITRKTEREHIKTRKNTHTDREKKRTENRREKNSEKNLLLSFFV